MAAVEETPLRERSGSSAVGSPLAVETELSMWHALQGRGYWLDLLVRSRAGKLWEEGIQEHLGRGY